MTKKKVLVTIIVILLIGLSVLGVLYFSNNKKPNNKPAAKTVDKIEGYDYSIKENDTKIKKEKFKELKDILSEDDVDVEKYALKLAEIFAVDVYDIDNKNSKYDVGGLEYVIPEQKDKFKLKLQDTLYNNVQDNFDNDRKQKLPIVTDAKASVLKKEKYTLEKKNYDCYNVKVVIDYEEDLGYDSTIVVKVIEKDDILFVVAVQPM